MKKVYIVGAGASFDFGFPVGEGLKSEITSVLSYEKDNFNGRIKFSDQAIHDAVLLTFPDDQLKQNELPGTADFIRSTLHQAVSIDNFIDNQARDDVTILSKLAIAQCILINERKCKLALIHDVNRPGEPFKNINRRMLAGAEKFWLDKFLKTILNCKRSEISAKFAAVSIICFNYDRCIEHYIWCWLINYYDIDDYQEAAKLLESLEILHPFCTLGALPWQDQKSQSGFGKEANGEQLLAISNEIKTFTELIGSDVANDIHRIVKSADQIVFLGFGFLDANLSLLESKGDPKFKRTLKIFGTSFNISDPKEEAYIDKLQSIFGINPRNHISLAKETASDVFDYFPL
jgi:hypothetical protein